MVWPISAEDVRSELQWQPDQGSEEELARHAAAAVARIEAEIGPHSGQPVSVVARGPRRAVVVPDIIAVLTAVIADGVDLPLERFTLDSDAGVVTGDFPAGTLVVTGTAPTAVPAPVELAARYLAATWVRQSRVGPPSARSRGTDTDGDVLQGFAMPRRVSEMIRPYVPTWGFA